MEQAGIGPRPVIGAIIVASGLAVSFLLWLLYVHHASADLLGSFHTGITVKDNAAVRKIARERLTGAKNR